jgi:hypothetical protein
LVGILKWLGEISGLWPTKEKHEEKFIRPHSQASVVMRSIRNYYTWRSCGEIWKDSCMLGGWILEPLSCILTHLLLWRLLLWMGRQHEREVLYWKDSAFARIILECCGASFLVSYREANQCTDALTNYGCLMDSGIVFFDFCPSSVRHLLLADLLGISTPCLI